MSFVENEMANDIITKSASNFTIGKRIKTYKLTVTKLYENLKAHSNTNPLNNDFSKTIFCS